MDDKTVEAPFRLAIREEGGFVNAYIASRETMNDAMLIGSIRKSIVADKNEAWDIWKKLMTDALAGAVVKILGVEPDEMVERRPPEHERSGNA